MAITLDQKHFEILSVTASYKLIRAGQFLVEKEIFGIIFGVAKNTVPIPSGAAQTSTSSIH
jgi:hypothetical protein